MPRDNLFSATKINPSREVEGVKKRRRKKKKLATAGSAYQRAQVKSVWCTFRFLLQQRRSVSVSDGLNEGLVSRATGSRSTRPGVCVYHQSALVSTAGYIQHSPPPSCLTPSAHTQTATFTGASPNTLSLPPTKPLPPPPSVHKSCTHTHTLNTPHLLTVDDELHLHTHTHTCTRSYVTRRTCGTTQIRSVNLHKLCSNEKKNMQRSNV